jgi:hypothetical protein
MRVVDTDTAGSFVPRVTFTDSSDAQDCYFAVAAMAQGALRDLSRAAVDEAATMVQVETLAAKHRRLLDLSTVLHDEWQRLKRTEGIRPV